MFQLHTHKGAFALSFEENDSPYSKESEVLYRTQRMKDRRTSSQNRKKGYKALSNSRERKEQHKTKSPKTVKKDKAMRSRWKDFPFIGQQNVFKKLTEEEYQALINYGNKDLI